MPRVAIYSLKYAGLSSQVFFLATLVNQKRQSVQKPTFDTKPGLGSRTE